VRIIDWTDLKNGKKKITEPVALTIGVFDGLHIGHQKLLKTIINEQDQPVSIVITFTSNPAFVLQTRSFSGSILTLNQKLSKIELFGISLVILIDFSVEFSKISGSEFWLTLLQYLHIKKIVVGRNFNFGNKRKSDIETLRKLSRNVEAEVVDPVSYKGKIVSSTRIRRLIMQGEFRDVTKMLGNNYKLDVSNTRFIHSEENIYQLDLKKNNQVKPADGSYSVQLETDRGFFPCPVTIQDGLILLKKYDDYSKIKNIIFI